MSQPLRKRILDHIKSGQLDNIKELIDQAIEIDNNKELYLLMDDLYAIGFYPEVKHIASHLLSKNPNDDQLRVILAEIAFEDGDDLKALSMIQAIESDSPAYLAAILVESDYYQGQGLPEVSIHKLKEAKTIYPDEEVIDFALAEMYLSTGQYGQAIPLYESLIDRGYEDFGEINLSGRLGTSYSAIGEFELGQQNLKAAEDTEENSDYLFQSILLSFQADDDLKVIEKSKKLVEMDPYYTSVYPLLISSYMRLDKPNEALKWAEKGLEYDHLNADLYLLLGQIYTRLGQNDQALDAYKEAYAVDPENDAAFVAYLDYLSDSGEYKQIISLLTDSNKEFQTIPRSIWLWAEAYNELELFDQARQKFEEAALYLSDSVPFLNDYLSFLIEDGQRKKAKIIVKKILQKEPDHVDALYWVENLSEE